MLFVTLAVVAAPVAVALAPSIAAAVKDAARIMLFVLAVLTQRYLRLPNADVIRLLAATQRGKTADGPSNRPDAERLSDGSILG